jgi:hypothetical protein
MNTVTRAVVAGLLVLVAIGVAAVLRRRRPEPPTQSRFSIPTQIDRADFPAAAGVPWLIAVFSSANCSTCQLVVQKANVAASREVAVHEIEYTRDRALHDRYAIDAVPTLVIADHEGVVRRSFQGPVTATDLWAAVAELRNTGQSEPCAE